MTRRLTTYGAAAAAAVALVGLAGQTSATAAVAKAAKPACSIPSIQKGNRGPAVATVQTALKMSNTDGIFGPITQASVKSFQAEHGITVTGQVGSSTWAALGCPTKTYLDKQVGSYLKGRAGGASVAVYDKRSGVTYTYRGSVQYDTASIVKVQVLATVLKQALDQHRSLTAAEKAKATSMIEFSDNTATTWLWNHVGGAPAVKTVDRKLGLNATVPGSGGLWGLTQTTAADQVTLLRQLAYGSNVLTPEARDYELGLMKNVTPSQKWGVSGGVTGATVALKNGWLQRTYDRLWRVNSVGHIVGNNRDYVIAVLTTGNSSEGHGITTIQNVSSMVFSTLGSPLK